MDTFNEDVDLFTKDTKGDEKLAVRFFLKAARDDAKSQEEGRMVFKDVEYIQIMVPGDRDNVVRPAGEGDKRRFARHYEAWKKDKASEQLIGTPLEMWGRLTLSQIEEFRYVGVRSVEQLAELNDSAMLRMPGAVDLKRKAQAFIQAAKDEAPMRHLQAELEKREEADRHRDAEMAAMKEQLAQLAAQNARQAELIAEAGAKRK